jgi:catechol 2,3-dioxygenase-like lactoylglutathione lyase family enzyme
MKRIHVHLKSRDLDEARRYYTTLFGQGPTLEHADYLKWRLDDPAINLAVTPGKTSGIEHLGLDVESDGELSTLRDRLGAGGYIGLEEDGTHCCYAFSDKVWSQDGDGIVWEGFLTHGQRETRDGDVAQAGCGGSSDVSPERTCCAG